MQSISEVIQKVTGKPASDEEVRRISAMLAAAGISRNDAFVTLVVILDHYYGIFGTMPDRINAAVITAAENAAQLARKQIETTAGAVQEELAKAVATSIKKTERAANTRTLLPWIIFAVCIICIFVGAISLIMFKAGYKSGANGLQAIAENGSPPISTQTWINTHSGQLAFAYYQSGQLDKILECKRQGWKIGTDKNGEKVCFLILVNGEDKEYIRLWDIPEAKNNLK